MSIDINNIGNSRPENTRRQDVNREAAESGKARSSEAKAEVRSNENGVPARGENVSLSDAAKQLAQLENSIKELPEVDASRVAQIKAKIDSGEYQVNSESLAQKMLDMDN